MFTHTDEGAKPIKINTMILTKEQIAQFEVAAKPLIKWMAENLHPHTTAIVDSNSAEILESSATIKTDEFVID